jgi:DMSO reductase family type II enzyme heme b subunit
VKVKAMHNGQTLAFHLHWQVPRRDLQSGGPDSFPDAAAIALNTGGEQSFHTMGKPGNPLNLWHWQANSMNNGRHLTSTGIGTTESDANNYVKACGLLSHSGWQIVIAHDLAVSGQDESDALKVGDEITFAVAIWDGNSEERGGLKAFSPDPLTLSISDKRG